MTATAISPAMLRRRIGDGWRVIEIARALGVSRSTIKNHCRANGIPLPTTPSGRLRRSPPIAEVLARLAAGETAAAIARSAGVSRPTIVRCLDRAGYALRGTTVTPKETANA